MQNAAVISAACNHNFMLQTIGVSILLCFTSIVFEAAHVVGGRRIIALTCLVPLLQLFALYMTFIIGERLQRRTALIGGYASALSAYALVLLSEVFERLNVDNCGRKCCLQSIGVRVLPTRLATSLNILALLSLATSTVVPCNAGICVISGEQASNLAEKKRIELFFSSFSELFNTQTATIRGTAFSRAFFWLLSAIMRVQKSKLTLKNFTIFVV